MIKEKTNLSHWIQFLISKKNRCAMWIIGDVSACIIILSIILLIIFNLGTTLGVIVSLPLFVLFFFVIYLALKKFPDVWKCTKLLEDIMKENITDSKEIRNIYFEEVEKMKWIDDIKEHVKSRKFFKFLRNLFLLVTIIFIGVDLILLYGLRVSPDISFTSLIFTLFSVAIACHAVVIAINSDEKMKSIATGDFFDLANRFWDRAPILYNGNLSKGARDTQSWQLENLFRQADKLKKWAEPDVQQKLIREFKTFLERLRKMPCKKIWGEVMNYKTTCNIALDFKSKDEEIQDEMIDELTNWLGEKNKGESNKEYINRKTKEFANKKDYDVFTLL